MPRFKRNFIIQLSDESRSNLEAVAKAAHTTDNKYIAQWAEELATVRPEFALKVLGLIPLEWKKRSVGRPPSTNRTDRNDGQLTAQDVA